MPSVRNILTDRLYLSAVGIVVVFLVAIAYLFAAVLDQPLTERPINVEVELEQTGGLFEGSVVTYRGVKVGKVTEDRADGRRRQGDHPAERGHRHPEGLDRQGAQPVAGR